MKGIRKKERKRVLFACCEKKWIENSQFLEENLRFVQGRCLQYCKKEGTHFSTTVSLLEGEAVVKLVLKSFDLAEEEWRLLKEVEPYLYSISADDARHILMLNVKFFE